MTEPLKVFWIGGDPPISDDVALLDENVEHYKKLFHQDLYDAWQRVKKAVLAAQPS